MKSRDRHSDASRRYHDRVARQYDSIYDDAYWEFHDRITWDAIKPHLPRDLAARCCDLGTGTGKWGAKLLKSGFPTTFVDHSAAMVEQARKKVEALGARAEKAIREDKARFLVADIIDMPALPDADFELVLAMGDPLSICADPRRAAGEMFRICKPSAIVIATADNKLAALDYFFQKNDLDGLQTFLKTSKTHWLTPDQREQFDLTTFTPRDLARLFERAGFDVVKVTGKTILPIREYRELLKEDGAGDRLMELEKELSDDHTAAARAAHLQIIARKPQNAA